MRILFCGGGTLGHIFPVIAMAQTVKEKYKNANIAFVVRKGGSENEVIKEKDYPIYEIDIESMKRECTPKNLKAGWKLIRSFKEAWDILRNFRPDLVIGSGGYVCFPVIFKAQLLHIHTVLHESNAIPGLAIRLLCRKADRVFLNFDGSEKYLPRKDNCVVTGTPVRKELYEITKEEAREKLHVKKDDFFIVSFGGTLGSQKMNEAILPLLPKEKTTINIRHIHAVGTRFAKEAKSRYPSLYQKNARVKIVPFIRDMPLYMKAADLVIARAGASTISELATAKAPSILIPSPNVTNNHQYENAKRLSDKNACLLLSESDLSPSSLFKSIQSLQKDPIKLEKYKNNVSAFSMEDASNKILSEIETILFHA